MEVIGVKSKELHSCWAGGRLDTRYNAKFQFHIFIGLRDNAGWKRLNRVTLHGFVRAASSSFNYSVF